MSQSEILEYLINERKTGNNKFLSVKYIAKDLKLYKKGLYRKLWKLCLFGYIEFKEKKNDKIFSKGFVNYKSFRVRKKYLT